MGSRRSSGETSRSVAETPSVDAWNVVDRTVTPNVTTGGIGFYEQGNHSLNEQWSVKSTNIIGAHQIKYGYEYDHVDWNQINNDTGPTLTAPNGQLTATGAQIQIIPDPVYGQVYRVVRARFTTGPTTTQSYQTFFVQDTWKVGNRLTVDPGLRYEQETLNGDVISGFSLKNNWAPRIGATYDATGDGKTKVYGNWGRFYARIPNDLAARALSSEVTMTRGDYFDANLTQPIPDGTLAGGQTTHLALSGAVAGDTIDPSSKMSYINEFIVGFERELMPHTSVGVRYIYRNIGRVRWHADDDHAQPVVQVLPKAAIGNGLFERHVRGGDDPSRHAKRSVATDGRTSPSSSTRSNRTCNAAVVSPISSSSTVPPPACSNTPLWSATAPVNAPR